MDNKEKILKEHYFPHLFMSSYERDFCLKILSNCKDISDSDHKIGNIGKCDIVEMRFKKENDIVRANGSLVIGNEDIQEYRTIDSEIFINEDNIIVDMLVTRLMTEDEHKQYRVLDQFKLENNVLKRRSIYNYDMKSIYDVVKDDEMKGRLKWKLKM